MNPCKIDMRGVDSKKIPFSGKMGNLGHRIIQDHKKAQQVTAFDWDKEQFVSTGIVDDRKKTVKAITAKLTLDNFAKNGQIDYSETNFKMLHRP